MTSKHDPELIAGHLAHYQLRSVEDWAVDREYRYDKHTDTWYNDDQQPVDIHAEFDKALDQLIEDCE
jgi:hypothetical protein